MANTTTRSMIFSRKTSSGEYHVFVKVTHYLTTSPMLYEVEEWKDGAHVPDTFRFDTFEEAMYWIAGERLPLRAT